MLKITEGLNPGQKEAVLTIDGPVLVLAGAGSGKTKTMVTRTAYLIQKGVNPSRILGLTFTKKAAREMLDRGISLLKESSSDIRLLRNPEFSNFHSFGYKLIKEYADFISEVKNENFTIADEGLQKSIIKQEIKYIFGEKSKDYNYGAFLTLLTFLENQISDFSSVALAKKSIVNVIEDSIYFNESDLLEDEEKLTKVAKLYVNYKTTLRMNGMVDFDDLINIVVRAAKENRKFGQILKSKFDYVMVDEYQDTNYAQIAFVKLFLDDRRNICAVGDNDQGIYGWRGAEIKYIIDFEKYFPGAKIINLSYNYRSKKEIVSLANKLMKNSAVRHKGKADLIAFDTSDAIVRYDSYFNDEEEGMEVALKIDALAGKGDKFSSIAVLSRTNQGLRQVEKGLIVNAIPYTIFKGRTLFNTKGFQELFAFLTIFQNPDNNIAVEEALTSTAKYISVAKMNEVRDLCLQNKEPILLFLEKVITGKKDSEIRFTSPQKKKILILINALKKIKSNLNDVNYVSEVFKNEISLISEHSRIIVTSKSETTIKQSENALKYIEIGLELLARYKNVKEFLDAMSLSADEDKEGDEEKVKLMTVHASKGLEFETVFLISLSDEIFPSAKNMNSEILLEEERRLMYVGITRAKKRLYLSSVQSARGKYGLKPSLFLEEIIAQ